MPVKTCLKEDKIERKEIKIHQMDKQKWAELQRILLFHFGITFPKMKVENKITIPERAALAPLPFRIARNMTQTYILIVKE